MADFVSVTLEDGSEVLFESAESDLVALRGGAAEIVPAGTVDRLAGIAEAAGQLRSSLKALDPDELKLEIGIGLSGEVGWFFAKSSMEGNLKVTLTWKASDA